MADQAQEKTGDPRLTVIAAAMILLLGVVAAIILTRGESEPDVVAAPADCIESWNTDPSLRALGTHQYAAHGYAQAQVVRLTNTGEPAEEPDGSCAVIFPKLTLDPEPEAAAQIFTGGSWEALSAQQGVARETLATLQSEAVVGANAALQGDGTLAAS